MNGKKAKLLRKKFNVKRVSHFDSEGNESEEYTYKTTWKGFSTGKLNEDGTPEIQHVPTHVASLVEDSPRKLYKAAKKQYTTTKEMI